MILPVNADAEGRYRSWPARQGLELISDGLVVFPLPSCCILSPFPLSPSPLRLNCDIMGHSLPSSFPGRSNTQGYAASHSEETRAFKKLNIRKLCVFKHTD